MKLSEHTISVLKNFASINQNLVIKQGKTLTTMSAMKNIIAKAEVEEDFAKEIAIYDLNEFLAALSLFKSPILDFQDNHVLITEENNTKNSLKYFSGNSPSNFFIKAIPSSLVILRSLISCALSAVALPIPNFIKHK